MKHGRLEGTFGTVPGRLKWKRGSSIAWQRFHRALESTATQGLLSILELAEHTGVATSPLRYHDDYGLVGATDRASGRHGHIAPVIAGADVIRLRREDDFSFGQIDLAGAAPDPIDHHLESRDIHRESIHAVPCAFLLLHFIGSRAFGGKAFIGGRGPT